MTALLYALERGTVMRMWFPACDGQVKTDTELSYSGQPFEIIRTDIPQIRM